MLKKRVVTQLAVLGRFLAEPYQRMTPTPGHRV